jgi:hypothetical protein
MNKELLKKHIASYLADSKEDPGAHAKDLRERVARIQYYKSWSKSRLLDMSRDDLYEYLSKLWALLIWGNKDYVVDKLIENNGLDGVRESLADLVWGDSPIDKRWDRFRQSVTGMGPAMISEILCHTHPNECMVWNRRALVAFKHLGVSDLPRYDYQLTGSKYVQLSSVALQIRRELVESGVRDADLLTVDYFIWDELQVEDNLSNIFGSGSAVEKTTPPELKDLKPDSPAAEFIHNEVRDKLADIGRWLGFAARIETKVADGSVVDAVWEATIGNMGRVIYVFEVQTKGSIDSLIVNLLKSLNNPAVQGVVAVSDDLQLEKIKKHAAAVQPLNAKLRYWNYLQILEVHAALQGVNEAINRLGLVPQGF